MKIPINIDYRDGRFTMRRTDTERYKGWPVDCKHEHIAENHRTWHGKD